MNVLFLVLAGCHVAIVVSLLLRWSRYDAELQRAAAIVMGVGLALAYDNLVVGLGATIGEGDLLANLNQLRFLLHVLITPLIILASVIIGQHGGVEFTARLLLPAQVLTVLMVGLGFVTNGFWPALEPELVSGVLRYVHPVPGNLAEVAFLFGLASTVLVLATRVAVVRPQPSNV